MRRLALAGLLVTIAACSTAGEAGPSPTSGSGGREAPPASQGSTSSGVSADVEGAGLTCWSSPAASGAEGISFSDQTETLGLVEPLVGMYGHAAVWGDLNGDDRADLFMGTFADRDADEYQFRGADGASPDQLLISSEPSFVPADDFPEMFSRTSGGTVADLDVDGDLDLILSRNFDDDSPAAPPSQILRNDGGTLVPLDGSGLPTGFGGRSVGVLDYDGDELQDLFIAEDRFTNGNSVLLHNEGNLSFSDATTAAGLPTGVHGLGVGVADLTGDGHQDIFVSGSNRLFVANGDGSFREVDSAVFAWNLFGEEDDIAGVSIADVNRDGMLDILIGQHFNSTVDEGTKVPVRLYLNRGLDDAGDPVFEDVTEAAGLVGLPTKAPHVELNDVDNDGWPDVVTTASATEGTRPAIFRHAGLDGDLPQFEAPAGLGSPQYWVAGPSADIDRDGRLDVFLVEWEPALPSLLLRNESTSGHWLEVSVGAEQGFGIGWRVEVYAAGRVGEAEALLGAREITVTQGYSAGVAPIAHFGLGEETSADVRLTPPNGVAASDLLGIGADQHLRFPGGCG